MSKTLKIMMSIALVAVLFVACGAFAASGDNVFEEALAKLGALFKNVRSVVYLLGAFALIGFAIAAIFGKLEWKKVAVLAVGLAVLAIADRVVTYAVDSEANTDVVEDWNVIESD